MDENYGILGFKEVVIKNKEKIWKLKAENNLLLGKAINNFTANSMEWQGLGEDFNGLIAFNICTDNELHCSYKNNKEQIIYRCFRENNADVINVVSEELEKVTFQKICIIGNKVGLVVFTENHYKKKWRIYYCFKKEGIWSNPQIVDEGRGFSPGTCAIVSHDQYLYLIYQIYDTGEYQLVYKVGMEKEWSQRSVITVSEGMNISPSALIDDNGNLHVAWLRWEGLKFKVMYKRKFKIQGFWLRTGWTKEQCLSSPEANCLLPVIVGRDENIEVFWQDKDLIYYYLLAKQKLCPLKNILVNKKKSSVSLNLEKVPGINLTTIDPGSTTLFLLTENFDHEDNINSPINNVSKKKVQYKLKKNKLNLLKEKIEEQNMVIERLEADLSQQKKQLKILREKENLQETIIKELRDKLLKKSEEDLLKKNQFNEKKLELEQEISRLRQSLEAVKEINLELRKRLSEKEAGEPTQKEINLKEKAGKEHPPFPFLRWK